MMNHIFAWLIIVSAVWGICQGRSGEVSSAILTSGGETVQLLITLTGAMAVWSGLMAIAEASGLTARIASLLRPVTRRLMPGLREGGEAEQYICLNIAANLLGLGNAATPPGLRAMNAIRRETCPRGTSASADMITFVVLNTASLQLIPTTLLVLRTDAGAAHPTEILPCVWLSSLAALTAGLTMSFILRSIGGNAPKRLSQQPPSRPQKKGVLPHGIF